jgi:hypothetical protein
MAIVYAQVAPEKSSDYAKMAEAVHAHLAEIDVAALQRLALRILLARETKVSPYNLQQKPKQLMAIAQLLGTSLDELAPTPKVPSQPAGELLSPFIARAFPKGLSKKPLDKWPSDVLLDRVRYAREQLAKYDDPTQITEGLNGTRESLFFGYDKATGAAIARDAVVADLALLTTAATARGIEIEVPVRVSDDDVQAVRAAVEHDEAPAGSGNDEEEELVWDRSDDDLELEGAEP